MKKAYLNLLILLCATWVLNSCKKELTFKPTGTSSLTIVNGMIGSNALLINFNQNKPAAGIYYAGLSTAYFGSPLYVNSYSGSQALSLYETPDTLDTSKPVYQFTLDLPLNTLHTLFLTGSIQSPDQLLTNDHLPSYKLPDSAMGLRFVNISKNSKPVSVNLIGQDHGSEVKSLSFKELTDFKEYPADFAVTGYTFEFRDVATGTLLATYTIDGINQASDQSPNTWRNRNFTLAFLNNPSGDGTYQIALVSENIQP